MKKFVIIKLERQDFDFLILATSYETPLYLWDSVKEALGTPKANLLLDLTLINGTKKNRYIRCNYEEGKNINKACSIVPEIDQCISNISYEFFSSNQEFLDQPFVPKAIKNLFLSQMI